MLHLLTVLVLAVVLGACVFIAWAILSDTLKRWDEDDDEDWA